jgi:hypothetical protein
MCTVPADTWVYTVQKCTVLVDTDVDLRCGIWSRELDLLSNSLNRIRPRLGHGAILPQGQSASLRTVAKCK